MSIFKGPIFIGVILTLVSAFDWGAATAYGQGSVIRKPAQEVIEALGRYFGGRGGRALTTELAELGGEAGVRRVAERAFREGGDDALNALVRSTRSHGGDAIRAADKAVNIPRLLRAVDDLPDEMASQAIRRLGAGAEGRLLAETTERFGAQVLRAEVRHPGIGGNLVRHLGDDGAVFAERATRQQAITISRHADDIARLPEAQRAGVLRLMKDDFDGMVSFMGRFIEKNPGKVLFTVAATTLMIRNPGIIDPEGDIVGSVVTQILNIILPILALAGAIWLGVKLWFHYRLAKLKYHVEAIGVTSKSKKVNGADEPNVKRR